MNYTALIFEDEAVISLLVSKHLKSKGFHVIAKLNGAKGVNLSL